MATKLVRISRSSDSQMMATFNHSAHGLPLANRRRWLRFALEIAVVSAILLGFISYFAKSHSPEAHREALLEAIRLTIAEPPDKNLKKALSIALTLADRGNRDAQVLAGILFQIEDAKAKAADQLRKAEAAGSLLACRRLIQPERAADGYKLAKCGDPFWQGFVGQILIVRDSPDPVSGIDLLEAGVKNGDPAANAEMGRLYGLGLHVRRDIAKAIEFSRFALDHGVPEAGFYLWTFSLNKRTAPESPSGPQSTDDIAACYKAAEMGDPLCQHVVAIAQGLGVGLPEDDVAAYMWINLAAANSSADAETRKKASKARDGMRTFLSPAQISEAQRMTREWKPKKFKEPEELPLIRAMRELRDEMDGKFPAIPELPLQTLLLSLGAPKTSGTAKPEPKPVESVVTSPAPQNTNGGAPDIALANPLEKLLKVPGVSGEIVEEVTGEKKPAGRKLSPSVTTNDFVSQSLCGNLVKDHASLSTQTGEIRGCKKLQRGGRSVMTVDNTANDTAVLVKLYLIGTPNIGATRIFTIQAKDTWTETDIREGIYELRYEDLVNRAFTKTESLKLNERRVADGVEFSRLKVTLYKVQNGNMRTQPIAKSEFDD